MIAATPPTGTKAAPSAFDGFAKAKPDEPIFTLLARDPLAAPLTMAWAWLNRVRAGAGTAGEDIWSRLRRAAEDNPHEPTKERQRAELIQSSEAEEIAWSMDDYRKGFQPEPESPFESYSGYKPDEKAMAKQRETDQRAEHGRGLSEAAYAINEAAGWARANDLPDVADELQNILQPIRAAQEAIRPSRAKTFAPGFYRESDHG